MQNYIALDTLSLSDIFLGRGNQGMGQTNANKYRTQNFAYMQDALNIPREKQVIDYYNPTLLLVDDI